MDGQLLWILLGAGELLMVLVLLLFVSWIRNVAARRRDKQAIKALVAEARKQKDQRIAQISEFLSAQFGMSGDALGLAVRAMYKAEARLIQSFASTYLQRDARSAARFRGQVEDSTEPYWALTNGAVAQVDAEAAQVPDEAVEGDSGEPLADDGEVNRLRGENDRLSEELRVTMDTMSRMLTEYSTIFAKDAEVADITVVDEAAPAGSAEPADEVAETAAEAAVAPEGDVHPTEAQGDDPDAILAAAAATAAAAASTAAAAEVAEAVPASDVAPADPDAILAEAGEPDADPDAILAAAAASTAVDAEVAEALPTDDDAAVDADVILAEAAESDADPDAILAAAAAAVVEDMPEEVAADDRAMVDADAILTEVGESDDDPDAVLAAVQEPASEGGVADDEPEGEDDPRFAVDLDSEMKDLSADEDEVLDLDLSEEEVAKAEAAAERQRVIDADS